MIFFLKAESFLHIIIHPTTVGMLSVFREQFPFWASSLIYHKTRSSLRSLLTLELCNFMCSGFTGSFRKFLTHLQYFSRFVRNFNPPVISIACILFKQRFLKICVRASRLSKSSDLDTCLLNYTASTGSPRYPLHRQMLSISQDALDISIAVWAHGWFVCGLGGSGRDTEPNYHWRIGMSVKPGTPTEVQGKMFLLQKNHVRQRMFAGQARIRRWAWGSRDSGNSVRLSWNLLRPHFPPGTCLLWGGQNPYRPRPFSWGPALFQGGVSLREPCREES